MKLHAIMSVIAISGLAVAAQAEEGKIAYPEGYRDWPHVKSMVILEGHGLADPFQGIHHLYANGAALAGYRTGNWPDGAVIVFDLLKYAEGGHALQEAASLQSTDAGSIVARKEKLDEASESDRLFLKFLPAGERLVNN